MSCEVFEAQVNRPKIASAPVTGTTANVFYLPARPQSFTPSRRRAPHPWLASALGHKACRDNRSVLYQRTPRLLTDLGLARGDGRHLRLDAAARHDLLEILKMTATAAAPPLPASCLSTAGMS